MKESNLILRSDDLEVVIQNPDNVFQSQRFASPGVIIQVVLHGKHTFCEPEQWKAERATCHGVGICGEFVWDELAKEVEPGQWFPKIGVGLLKQRKESGPYDMWKSYECRHFPVTFRQMEQQVVFFQKQELCLGVAASLTRTISVYRNTITVNTELENTGERIIDLMEYQHNFLSIDQIPMGPGYQLAVPFDGTAEDIVGKTVSIEDYRTPIEGVLQVRGSNISYQKIMERIACHKVTEAAQILHCPVYRWSLRHEVSQACVSETVYFLPERLVIWGIEHCICAEVYDRWIIEPGKRRVSARTWCFEDEETGR